MLSALEARLVVVVLALMVFIAVVTVFVRIRPAAARVDATELCTGIESDHSVVCVPLP